MQSIVSDLTSNISWQCHRVNSPSTAVSGCWLSRFGSWRQVLGRDRFTRWTTRKSYSMPITFTIPTGERWFFSINVWGTEVLLLHLAGGPVSAEREALSAVQMDDVVLVPRRESKTHFSRICNVSRPTCRMFLVNQWKSRAAIIYLQYNNISIRAFIVYCWAAHFSSYFVLKKKEVFVCVSLLLLRVVNVDCCFLNSQCNIKETQRKRKLTYHVISSCLYVFFYLFIYIFNKLVSTAPTLLFSC